jgi:hypothetical protein
VRQALAVALALDPQRTIAKAQAAREAIDDALRCPDEDILQCLNSRQPHHRPPRQPLHEAHSH